MYVITAVGAVNPRPKAERAVPKVLLGINVISVQWSYPLAPNISFQQAICESFDFTLCCVAMGMDVHDNFHFRTFHDADGALQNKKLVLTPCCFAGTNSTSVHSHMARIIKYLRRGFRW